GSGGSGADRAGRPGHRGRRRGRQRHPAGAVAGYVRSGDPRPNADTKKPPSLTAGGLIVMRSYACGGSSISTRPVSGDVRDGPLTWGPLRPAGTDTRTGRSVTGGFPAGAGDTGTGICEAETSTTCCACANGAPGFGSTRAAIFTANSTRDTDA